MTRSIAETLATANFHLAKAIEHGKLGLENDVVIDGCALRLLACIDALGQLPDDLLEKLFGDDWPLMRGMQNRIAHGYAIVDRAILEHTIRYELPELQNTITTALDTELN